MHQATTKDTALARAQSFCEHFECKKALFTSTLFGGCKGCNFVPPTQVVGARDADCETVCAGLDSEPLVHLVHFVQLL